MSEAESTPFIIVDPSLYSMRGHAYHYDKAIMSSLINRCHDVYILGPQNISPQIELELSVKKNLPPHTPIIIQQNRSYLLRLLLEWNQRRALQESLLNIDIRSGSIIFCPSTQKNELLAWIKLLKSCKNDFRLILNFFTCPNEEDPLSLGSFFTNSWGYLLENLGQLSHGRVILTTDTETRLKSFSQTTSLQVRELPIPFAYNVDDCQHRALNEKDTLVVGTFGNLRDDKGWELFLQAAQQISLNFSNIRFVFHGAPAPTLTDRYISDLKKKFDEHSVQFYFQVLDSFEYLKVIQSMDICVLPYTDSSYLYRSSGALIEALSMNKPVIVPSSTWLANVVDKFGGGISFIPNNANSLLESIRTVISEYSMYSENASLAGEKIRQSYSSDSVCDFLLALSSN